MLTVEEPHPSAASASSSPVSPDGPAALFPEAKQRERRRRMLVATAVLLLVSGGIGFALTADSPPRSISGPGTTSAESRIHAPLVARTTTFIEPTSLVGIAFSSPEDGIGLFAGNDINQFSDTPDTSYSCSYATRSTTDGGVRFSSVGASFSTKDCASGSPVDALAIDSSRDVFAYRPSLYISHNWGTTWSNVQTHANVVSVVAVARSVWVLTSTCNAASSLPDGVCRLRLIASADGGRTWSAPITAPPVMSSPQFFQESWYNYLAREGPNDAYLALPSATSAPATIEATTNGGRSWSISHAPCIMGGIPELAVAPNSTVWLACGGEGGTGQQPKTLTISRDGGATWSASLSCDWNNPAATIGPPCDGYLGQIVALSSTTGFLVGARSSLTATFDAGRSWIVIPGFLGTAGGSNDVIFANASDGWALDGGSGWNAVLWRTTNGGRSWEKMPKLP